MAHLLISYRAAGYHRIALQVFGTGAVSNLVRKIFKDFDVEEKLEKIASNARESLCFAFLSLLFIAESLQGCRR